MTALPLASVVGAPISGILLSTGGVAGLSGWQTLFVAEALPSLLLTVVLLAVLTDRPNRPPGSSPGTGGGWRRGSHGRTRSVKAWRIQAH